MWKTLGSMCSGVTSKVAGIFVESVMEVMEDTEASMRP